MSMRRPVGSSSMNGAPVKWPPIRHSTAARWAVAATRSTVVSTSGRAANMLLKKAPISAWPRRIPYGTMSATPSSTSARTIAAGSRAARASK